MLRTVSSSPSTTRSPSSWQRAAILLADVLAVVRDDRAHDRLERGDVVDQPVDVARVAGLVLVEPRLGGLDQLAGALVVVEDLVLEDDQLLVRDEEPQVADDHDRAGAGDDEEEHRCEERPDAQAHAARP